MKDKVLGNKSGTKATAESHGEANVGTKVT